MLGESFDDGDNDGGRSGSSLRCHSQPPHVDQNYTTSTGLSPGGVFVTVSTLQNSLFMPRHNVSG